MGGVLYNEKEEKSDFCVIMGIRADKEINIIKNTILTKNSFENLDKILYDNNIIIPDITHKKII